VDVRADAGAAMATTVVAATASMSAARRANLPDKEDLQMIMEPMGRTTVWATGCRTGADTRCRYLHVLNRPVGHGGTTGG
jgi:hypothetical protein